MIPFCLAVAGWIVDALVDGPVLPHQRIRVHAARHTDPLDQATHVPAVLAPDQLDPMRESLIDDRFIARSILRTLASLRVYAASEQCASALGRDVSHVANN